MVVYHFAFYLPLLFSHTFIQAASEQHFGCLVNIHSGFSASSTSLCDDKTSQKEFVSVLTTADEENFNCNLNGTLIIGPHQVLNQSNTFIYRKTACLLDYEP
jgi:hypothetical protein